MARTKQMPLVPKMPAASSGQGPLAGRHKKSAPQEKPCLGKGGYKGDGGDATTAGVLEACNRPLHFKNGICKASIF